MADNFLEDDIFSDLEDLDDYADGTPEDEVEVKDEEDVVEKEPASTARKDETKAFSERLKKEKEKLAKQLGYAYRLAEIRNPRRSGISDSVRIRVSVVSIEP